MDNIMTQLNRTSVKWLLERVEAALKLKNMSQSELARAIGVKPPNLNRAIKAITEDEDQRFPDLQLLLDAAKVLEIKVRIVMTDRKSTRLNSSHSTLSRMPSSA